ncbi:MAG: hypothetical protein ACOCRO_07985 [Halanaerobiales bacterium]
MTIAEQLERQQPQIYNFLIDLFGLRMQKTERVEPVNFEEDDYHYRYFRNMMTEKKAVKL